MIDTFKHILNFSDNQMTFYIIAMISIVVQIGSLIVLKPHRVDFNKTVLVFIMAIIYNITYYSYFLE